jgi:hypothetical protein
MEAYGGRLILTNCPPQVHHLIVLRPGVQLGFQFWSAGGLWRVHVPLWVALGPGAAGMLWAWSSLPAKRSACLLCDYDRSGLRLGAPCPECGHTVGAKP